METRTHNGTDVANKAGARRKTVGRWVFAGFVTIAIYFLVTEHRADLFDVLPYLLLAACPLMHLFHHHRDSADRAGGEDPGRSSRADR